MFSFNLHSVCKILKTIEACNSKAVVNERSNRPTGPPLLPVHVVVGKTLVVRKTLIVRLGKMEITRFTVDLKQLTLWKS